MRALILIVCITAVYCASPTKLGQYGVDKSHLTLSGFSSGGTFAQMMQFSYSSKFTGIAVFSHTFYRCGKNDGKLDNYDRLCTKLSDLRESEYYNPELVHNDIADYHRRNLIENPAQLQNKRLYVYTGLRNFLFTPAQSLGILNVYERYVKNPKTIRTRVQDANLVLPSDNPRRGSCTELDNRSVFVGNCGLNGPYDALNFLLHGEIRNQPQAGRSIRLQPLLQFDQTEFYRGIDKHQMDSIGFLYVPTNCRNANNGRCLLHFYFHGCLTGREFNGTQHIELSGFLEVAELNNVIMVFPQAVSSLPENEIGCWDTFGISGPLYATKEGAQIKVVKGILDRILGGGQSSTSSSDPQSSFSNSFASASSWSSGGGSNGFHSNWNRNKG